MVSLAQPTRKGWIAMKSEHRRNRLRAVLRRRCRNGWSALYLLPAIALMAADMTAGSALQNAPRPVGKPAAQAQLTVRLTGLHDRRGQVVVALFNRAEGFPERGALATQKIDLSKGAPLNPLIVIFRNLTPGVYAVSAYHDANS